MKKKWVKFLLLVLVLAVCAYMAYSTFQVLTDQSHIEKRFYQVVTDKLDVRVRAVFLSDLHLSEFGEDNCDLIASIQELAPDIILVGGDMTIRYQDYSIVITLCKELVKIAPVYYGLGNHEIAEMVTQSRQIFEDIKATGVIMVHDTMEKATVGSASFWIGGLNEYGSAIEKYSGNILGKLAEKEGFKLLLSHYPTNFDTIINYDIDLVLSGHLHGGQIRLPYFGGLYSPDDGFLPKYTSGLFQEQDTTMIVTTGLGNSHKLPRFNNPPELVVVDFGAQGALTAAEHEEERKLSSDEKPIVYIVNSDGNGGKLDEVVKEKDTIMETYTTQLLELTEAAQSVPPQETNDSGGTVQGDVIYSLTGSEVNVRLDNILRNVGSYRITAADSAFTDETYRLPDVSGQRSFTITDDGGSSQTYTFVSARIGAKTTVNQPVNVMLLGDDFLADGTLPCDIKRMVTEQFGLSNVNFIGSHNANSGGLSCAYEGYAGYGFTDLLKLDDGQGNGAQLPNPYLVDGAVSLAGYVARNALPTPDVFVLYMGMNDLINGSDVTIAAGVAGERAKAFVDLLHNELPSASILLCGPAFVSDGNGRMNAASFNQIVEETNSAYRSLCAKTEYTSYCTYVNTAFTFDRNNAYQPQDENGGKQTSWLMPSEYGYQMIAGNIAAALMSVVSD